MSTNLNYKQVANVSRRTWDVETYAKRAEQRAGNEPASASSRPPNRGAGDGGDVNDGDGDNREEFVPAAAGAAGPHMSRRAFLKARTHRLDGLIDGKVGSVEIVNPEAVATTRAAPAGGGDASATAKSGVGWHCKVCDCFLRDSLTYLDHINGKKHQRNLGYSMRVERSTKDQVMSRLAVMAKEQASAKAKSRLMGGFYDEEEDGENYHDIVKAKDEELERRKEERKRERKERKKVKKEATKGQQQVADETFGGGIESDAVKEKKTIAEQPDGEEEEEKEEGGIDPGLAAMMGFTGFGGGSKNR